MKKLNQNIIKKFVLAILLLFFSFAPNIQATDSWLKTSRQGLLNTVGEQTYTDGEGNSQTDPRLIIAQIIRQVIGLLGVIFLALLVLSGFKYMNSKGNEEEAKKALNYIRDAVIGLVIIVIAFGIAAFIISSLVASVSDCIPNEQACSPATKTDNGK